MQTMFVWLPALLHSGTPGTLPGAAWLALNSLGGPGLDLLLLWGLLAAGLVAAAAYWRGSLVTSSAARLALAEKSASQPGSGTNIATRPLPVEAPPEDQHETSRIQKDDLDRIRLLIDEINEVIFQLDHQLCWSFLNPAWAQISKHPVSQSIGKPLIEYIHPDDQGMVLPGLKGILAGEREAASLEARLVQPGGEIRWVEIHARRIPGAAGSNDGLHEVDGVSFPKAAVSGAMTDIHERKRAETALRRSEETLRALYNITSSHQLTFSNKIQALLVMGSQQFGMEIAILSNIAGNRYEIQEVYAPGTGLTSGTTLLLENTYCRDTLRSGGLLDILHAGASEWFSHPCYTANRIEAYLGTPVTINNQVYGTLNFSSLTPRSQPFTTGDKELLHLMAQWIGGEIEHLLNTQQLERFTSEIARKSQALAEARDRAIETANTKADFLATMSHEIRTPINAVLGMAELLLNTKLDPEQLEYAGIIRDSTQILLTLIGNLLDLSKIEAGKLDLEAVDFNLHELVESTAEMFSSQVYEKGLHLMTFVDPRLPVLYNGDPTRLRQILFNLVGNAIKFTEEGEVIVRATSAADGAETGNLRFEVQDTGIGIAESTHKRLFQPFTQADSSTTRKYGGTGLGLAICKRLVEALGGEISLDSVEGKGSTFTFTVKLGATEQAEQVQRLLPAPSPRALIVSANSSQRQIFDRYLAAWGFKPSEAATGEQALVLLHAAQAAKEPFRIILMDLPTQAGNGTSLSQAVLQDRELRTVRQVLIADLDERSLVDEALKAGCSAFVLKPVKGSALHEAALKAASDLSPLPEIRLPEAEPGILRVIVDRPRIGLILLAEDNPANQKLTSIQLQKLGYRVDCVHNGRQVVEIILQTNQSYAMILMDCQMPEVDGYSATRIIRKAELTTGRHIPIIAMTANALQGDRESCLAAGMDDYLCKPIRLEQLRQIVDRWSKENQVKEAQVSIPQPDGSQGQPLDPHILAGIRELQLPGESDFLTDLIDLYLTDSTLYLDRIKTALEQDDAEALQRAAHTLKGSSSNMGAVMLSRLCADLEALARDRNLQSARLLQPRIEDEYARVWQALIAERKPASASSK